VNIPLPPALQHRRYRLLWLGLMISIAGTRMQTAAVLWHIRTLSDQPIHLGIVGLVNIVPVLFFSLLAGTVADTFNRRRLMFASQSAAAILAGVLGWFTEQGQASLVLIYTITALTSAVAAFDLPARQALVPNLVPRDVLTNAFSLNSIAFQTGAIAGPALAGVVIAQSGVASAYWVNAISFGAVLLALVLMGPVEQTLQLGNSYPTRKGAVLDAVREGLGFVFSQPIILSSMLLDFFATFFSSATFLLPIFAQDILEIGPQGYGWLLAAPSIGAGTVALSLSFVSTIHRQGFLLFLAVAGFGLATILFGFSVSFPITFLALSLTGATDGLSTIIRNTIRQIQTPDRLRGRMTSVNQMFFMGGPQLGELEAGLVAQVVGAPAAVITGGIGCLLATTLVALRFPQLRQYDGSEPLAVEA
jgi:MFS family permease